jgi:hypothetical protein
MQQRFVSYLRRGGDVTASGMVPNGSEFAHRSDEATRQPPETVTRDVSCRYSPFELHSFTYVLSTVTQRMVVATV